MRRGLCLIFFVIVCTLSVIQSLFLGQTSRQTCSRRRTQNILHMAPSPFNPFTSRQRNTKVKWFEADLDSFYLFVENQPLLTAEQEFNYGKALRMWSKAEDMRLYLQSQSVLEDKVSDEKLADSLGCSVSTLAKMSKYSDVAKSRLVNSNLKLVLAVVSRYRSSAIPNSELIAEGTRGLSRAVLRYDYTKGFRFATYATWYVHQAISEYVRWRKHPAKMPSRYLLLWRRVKQYSSEYKILYNCQPTVYQLSEALGQSHFDIVKVLSMQTYPVLLHSPIKSKESHRQEGKERTMEDVLPSMFTPPLAQSDNSDLRRNMENMMQVNLNAVERDILRLRLGLDDGQAKAVKEVGKKFKISWKKVRQVEKNALSKLLSSEEITDFVDNFHSV